MSLIQWAENGWLIPHKTSKQEISNLLILVERDVTECAKDLTPDWLLNIAYNAALGLCTILLYSSGYKAARQLQYYRTIQSLSLILGDDLKDDTAYLDSVRKRRHISAYESSGATTQKEADELLKFVMHLRENVINWLAKNHSELLDPEP
ncbi:hypothetical protein JXI42_11555 [bacterium]|nr:hypothetical protein [bacterium]